MFIEWGLCFVIVVILLICDLFFFNKKGRAVSVQHDIYASIFYVVAATLFGLFIWYDLGYRQAVDYATGYIIEKTLSVDNLFVISMIFQFFNIKQENQRRVLLFGIGGVVLLRGVLIFAGTALIGYFHWVLDIFAVFLIVLGVKMFKLTDDSFNIEEQRAYKWLKKIIPVASIEDNTSNFFAKVPIPSKDQNSVITHYKTMATPLFICLVMIEITDLIFALDSLPAIFAITTNPFIVFSSNIFAILGLRALYSVLSRLIKHFEYLKYSLAIILVMIGVKGLLASYMHIELPSTTTLCLTMGLLAAGVLATYTKSRN